MSDSVVGISLPSGLFKDKVALVTGSSRGVGRATAVRLAEGGANVVVNYLSNDYEARDTVRMCEDRGARSIAVAADTSEFMAAQSLAKAAVDEFGGIDLLVLNAGVWEGAPIEDMTEDIWNKVINT